MDIALRPRERGILRPAQARHAACACPLTWHMYDIRTAAGNQDSSPGIQQRIPAAVLQPAAPVRASIAGADPIPIALCMPVMLQQTASVKHKSWASLQESSGPPRFFTGGMHPL